MGKNTKSRSNFALSSDPWTVLIDTTCRKSFQNPLDGPDITQMVWTEIQACLEDRVPGNPMVNDEETSALRSWPAPSRRPKRHLLSSTAYQPAISLPTSIHDVIRLKNRLKRPWQVTRDPSLKGQVNRLQTSVTYLLSEWRNEQLSDPLESPDSEDQLFWRWQRGWCEFRLRPCKCRKDTLPPILRKRKLCRTAWTISFSRKPAGTGSYLGGL
jgi:hypothetical protein